MIVCMNWAMLRMLHALRMASGPLALPLSGDNKSSEMGPEICQAKHAQLGLERRYSAS